MNFKELFDKFLESKGRRKDYYSALKKDESFFVITVPDHWIVMAFHYGQTKFKMQGNKLWDILDKDWRTVLEEARSAKR